MEREPEHKGSVGRHVDRAMEDEARFVGALVDDDADTKDFCTPLVALSSRGIAAICFRDASNVLLFTPALGLEGDKVARVPFNSMEVRSLAFHPDGVIIAVGMRGEDGPVNMYDIDRRCTVTTLFFGERFLNRMTFHPTGQQLAAVSVERLRLWRLSVAVGIDNEAEIVNVGRISTYGGGTAANILAYHPQGTYLLVDSSNELVAIDPVTEKPVSRCDISSLYIDKCTVVDACYSPSGDQLCVCFDIWTPGRVGRLAFLDPHTMNITALLHKHFGVPKSAVFDNKAPRWCNWLAQSSLSYHSYGKHVLAVDGTHTAQVNCVSHSGTTDQTDVVRLVLGGEGMDNADVCSVVCFPCDSMMVVTYSTNHAPTVWVWEEEALPPK